MSFPAARAALAIVDKRRVEMNVAEVMHVIGDVKQRNLVEGPTLTVYFYAREPYVKATRRDSPPDSRSAWAASRQRRTISAPTRSAASA